jgi:hypothetical protein
MKTAIGYKTPQEGKADKGGSYTVWVQLPTDRKWYSPKDISGISRNTATHEHLRVLNRKIRNLRVVRVRNNRTEPMNSDQRSIKRLLKDLGRKHPKEFPETGRPNAPREQGVYVIFNPQGRVVHVGRTLRAKRGIFQRLCDHLATRSSFTNQYPPLKGNGANLREGYKFSCLRVTDDRNRALLEALAIGCLRPAHIGLGAKTTRRS